jgi:hypothetical protein
MCRIIEKRKHPGELVECKFAQSGKFAMLLLLMVSDRDWNENISRPKLYQRLMIDK